MATSAPRDPYLDNARAILIALVVVGHLLQAVETYSANIVVQWVYAFHMPAFVLVTGHLSRSYRGTPQQAGRLFTTLIVPYLVFQTIHDVARALYLDRPVSVSYVTPAWTLWFLVALCAWRLATPVLQALRHPLLLALAVSLAAPLDAAVGPELSVGRILGMAPFYVAGLVLTREHLMRLRRPWVRVASGALLLGGLVASWAYDDTVTASWFFMNRSHADLEQSAVAGLGIRALGLVVGFAGTAAVLALTPGGQHWWTRTGRYSLYVYLLHPFVLFPVRYGEAGYAWTETTHTVALVLVGVVLAAALASPPVVAIARWVVEPPFLRALLRRTDTAPRT